MGIIRKIFGDSNEKEDQINKFESKTLFEKRVQLEAKSDDLVQEIQKIEKQIDALVESSKGTNPSEKRRIASRIKTLQEKKAFKEDALFSVEQELRAVSGIEIVREGDKIPEMGVTSKINAEKMEKDLIDRRLKAQEREEKISTVTSKISATIKPAEHDSDSDEILDMLNELDEGNLEPDYVKEKLSKNVE